MPTVTLQDASTRLAELIRTLSSADILVITENDQPIAEQTATEKLVEKSSWP